MWHYTLSLIYVFFTIFLVCLIIRRFVLNIVTFNSHLYSVIVRGKTDNIIFGEVRMIFLKLRIVVFIYHDC